MHSTPACIARNSSILALDTSETVQSFKFRAGSQKSAAARTRITRSVNQTATQHSDAGCVRRGGIERREEGQTGKVCAGEGEAAK
eukprot:496484-Rhodomonas_salina.1